MTSAARKVNAETQNKVSRRDANETALFQSVFSKDAPRAGQPRLRPDGGSDTSAARRGAAAFTEGSHAALRNPNRHEDVLSELPEHQALEQPAAFSVLARWVEEAALLPGQD